MKKIVICGGHLTPALALIEELQKKGDLTIVFFGRKYATEGSSSLSAEYKSISAVGIKFYEISAGRIQRKFTKYTLGSFLKIPIGFIQSLFYLLKVHPDLIVSFGGYLSAPVVFASWLIGIDSVTHEQSTVPGLATKINSLFTKKILLTWRQSADFFSKEKSQVIGNLIRQSIFKKNAKDARIQKFIKSSRRLIFITGGNQGSYFINGLIFNLLPQLKSFQILHQVGTANFRGDLDKARKVKRQNYLAVDYLDTDNIGPVFARSNLVVARSGANTVWDLAILGKVAILIPLPHAASGEQEANAQILEKAGSAIILNQKDLTPQILKQKIDYVFKSLPKFQKNAQTFSQTLPKSASKALASEVLKLIED